MNQTSTQSHFSAPIVHEPYWFVIVIASHGEIRRPLQSFAQLGDFLHSIEDAEDAKIYLLRRSDSTQPSKSERNRAKNHTFYVQKQSTTILGGDGSRLRPWWGMDSAIESLYDIWASRQMIVEENDGILLRYQEAFSTVARDKYRFWMGYVHYWMCALCTVLLIIPTCILLAYMVYRAWPLLTWNFLSTNPQELMQAGGILAPLIGTFMLVVLSMLISAPLGVLASIYLSEYAGENRWTRLINLAVLNLAGIPSIIYALVGFGLFVLTLDMGISLLAAVCTVSIMPLPVIITCTREALESVPQAFRVSCWHQGVTRWQTIRTVVLPNAMSGILTGVILQVSRVASETAPIWFTGVVFYSPMMNRNRWGVSPFPDCLHEPMMALSTHLYVLVSQSFNASENLLYAVAVVLVGLILFVNSGAILLRVRSRTVRNR